MGDMSDERVLFGWRLVSHRRTMARQCAQAPQQGFHVTNPKIRRGKRHARACAEAIELKVPLTVEVRLRQGDAPVAIENAVYCFAEAKLQRRRDIPQTKRDRH